MLKFTKRTAKKAGTAPGTLVHVGEKKTDQIHITVTDYDIDHVVEESIVAVEESFRSKETATKTWINIDGIHDVDMIRKIGHQFTIHPLILEDIVNSGQRPKAEEFDNYVYFVFKMLYYDEAQQEIRSEQISLILGALFLFSFQEMKGDVFDVVRERIRQGKGRIRKAGCDYLAYALIDAVVDHYFLILEKLGEKIEGIEEALLDEPRPDTVQQIHEMKRELIYMRKQIWPFREMINNIQKGEYNLVEDATMIFFKDVYDHCIQVIDTIESYRDVLSGMLDLYLSTISNRMNEVMKVLTIIATIFIPLSFLAGVYGMNFEFMPELHWKWGYFVLWATMFGIIIAMLTYFKRKKWL